MRILLTLTRDVYPTASRVPSTTPNKMHSSPKRNSRLYTNTDGIWTVYLTIPSNVYVFLMIGSYNTFAMVCICTATLLCYSLSFRASCGR
ncbi:hypothetical protein BDY19DRAFT_651563 [Irpex rosettiformis]|uniref:Uncharacterized protein n=1 Tax=Irpex rosettiformis TaxID=378272 RepID=A0ACB8TNJ7_9APHY|nr:hypothetical protein BDY19DRAFT_651563 [Irpex rosettiformis]